MLYQWIKDEAQAKLVNGYRIVISDPKREAHFLLNQLGKDFTLISADGDWEEFTARYTAEKEYPYAQVVFYTHTCKKRTISTNPKRSYPFTFEVGGRLRGSLMAQS